MLLVGTISHGSCDGNRREDFDDSVDGLADGPVDWVGSMVEEPLIVRTQEDFERDLHPLGRRYTPALAQPCPGSACLPLQVGHTDHRDLPGRAARVTVQQLLPCWSSLTPVRIADAWSASAEAGKDHVVGGPPRGEDSYSGRRPSWWLIWSEDPQSG